MAFMLLILITSAIPMIRRKRFNLFLGLHWVLFLACAAGAWIHQARWVWIGFGLWSLDALIRYVYMAGGCQLTAGVARSHPPRAGSWVPAACALSRLA
jgi:hypothetical protein